MWGNKIVNDLSVEMFLQALRRFAARRSLPHILISDNASTFEAAAKDLEEFISSTQMSESLCYEVIQIDGVISYTTEAPQLLKNLV